MTDIKDCILIKVIGVDGNGKRAIGFAHAVGDISKKDRLEIRENINSAFAYILGLIFNRDEEEGYEHRHTLDKWIRRIKSGYR